MSPHFLTLILATQPFESDDFLHLKLVGDESVKGWFFWTSHSCIQLQYSQHRIKIPAELIQQVKKNDQVIPLSVFKQDMSTWWELERQEISQYPRSLAPSFVASTAFVSAGTPYIFTRDWKDFWAATALEGVLLGGIAYGTMVDEKLGTAIPFAITDILFRLWASRDAFSRVVERQKRRRRIKESEKNCN